MQADASALAKSRQNRMVTQQADNNTGIDHVPINSRALLYARVLFYYNI